MLRVIRLTEYVGLSWLFKFFNHYYYTSMNKYEHVRLYSFTPIKEMTYQVNLQL